MPVRETEIGKEPKASIVSLSNISENAPFFEELQPAVNEQFITQLNAHSLCDQYIAKQSSNNSNIQIKDFSLFHPFRW